MILASLFEELDLHDLWLLDGQIKNVSVVWRLSIAKVSRCSRTFLDCLGLLRSEGRGAPDPQLLRHSGSASLALRELTQQRDVLHDVVLSADQISDHRLEHCFDLFLSSLLELAGEQIHEVYSNADSPFLTITLFEDPVMLSLCSARPQAGLPGAASEDYRRFHRAGYPDGSARLPAESALSNRPLVSSGISIAAASRNPRASRYAFCSAPLSDQLRGHALRADCTAYAESRARPDPGLHFPLAASWPSRDQPLLRDNIPRLLPLQRQTHASAVPPGIGSRQGYTRIVVP